MKPTANTSIRRFKERRDGESVTPDPMPPDKTKATAGNGGESNNYKAAGLPFMVAQPTDSGREARRRVFGHVVVVRNGGRWTRAVYLSLHSANQAVERARARGAEPYLVLVELVPVGEVTR